MATRAAIEAADRFRAALLAKDATAAGRLTRAYGRIYRDLVAETDDLLASLWDAEAGEYRKSIRADRLRALKKQVVSEIDKYGVYADTEMLDGAEGAIGQALGDSRTLTQLSLPGGLQEAGIMGQWNRLPTEAVEQMLGFLGSDSPLHGALVNQLGPAVADRVGDAMVKGIALGWNPRRVARAMTKSFGSGLTWSMTTVRTAQIWSYREATRASYLTNPRIVKGWVWHAELDTRTCMSCVALHGSVHKLSEPMEDHHNGRCAMVPETVTYRDLGFDVDTPAIVEETGKEWFVNQPATTQREMMGVGAYDQWKAGAFKLDDMSQAYLDPVYGIMRRQATLGELVPSA